MYNIILNNNIIARNLTRDEAIKLYRIIYQQQTEMFDLYID